jgi:membrane protein YdbS with pleckstrin-like domain
MDSTKYFFGQHKNEKLIFFSYKHGIYFISKMWKNVFMFFSAILFFLIWFLASHEEGISFYELVHKNQTFIVFFYLWLLIHIHVFFAHCIQYMFNIIIVSDSRVIEIRQGIFFKENIESIDLFKIQDIQGHKNGVLENLFNFGCLSCTFATIANSKNIYYLPRPLDFVDWLNLLRRRIIYKHEQIDEDKSRNTPTKNHINNNLDDEIII